MLLDETSQHFFVKDKEHPYVQEKPFDWIRGYQVGGKSLLWARATQRWSNFDFEGPARDGFAVDWPIRYEDMAPWYSHVEILRVSVVIKMDWKHCLTENFFRHGK